jgi:hypothetical protein
MLVYLLRIIQIRKEIQVIDSSFTSKNLHDMKADFKKSYFACFQIRTTFTTSGLGQSFRQLAGLLKKTTNQKSSEGKLYRIFFMLVICSKNGEYSRLVFSQKDQEGSKKTVLSTQALMILIRLYCPVVAKNKFFFAY